MKKVDEHLDSLVKLYALICNHGDDLEAAKQELSIHLREHVVWERNTVWRDMIGLERKSYAANSKLMNRSDGNNDEKEDGSGNMKLMLKFNISLKNPVVIKLILIFAVTVFLLNVSPFDDSAQKKLFCFVNLCIITLGN